MLKEKEVADITKFASISPFSRLAKNIKQAATLAELDVNFAEIICIIPEECADYYDVFSKEVSNILLFYWSYNYRITLKQNKFNLTYSPLYKISIKELKVTK